MRVEQRSGGLGYCNGITRPYTERTLRVKTRAGAIHTNGAKRENMGGLMEGWPPMLMG